MKYYFHLQYKIISRTITDFGVPVWLGYLGGLILFLLFSVQVFEKLVYASYMYGFMALLVVQPLSSLNRNEFLEIHFPNYKLIRSVENFLVSIPFILFLLYKKEFLLSGILPLFLVLSAFIRTKIGLNFFIPTPFKAPFEFNLGFRKTVLIWFITYFGIAFSIWKINVNIGVAILLSTFFISTSFYNFPEPEYYLWNYKSSAKKFIHQKIKIALFHSTVLIFPVLVSLCIHFPNDFYGLCFCYAIGLLFLLTIVLAKYASYPEKISLIKGFIIVSCIYFPPFIIFVLIYFYYLSIKKLNGYLK